MFAVGMYRDKQAKLYEMTVTKIELGGNILERKKSGHDDSMAQEFEARMARWWFRFVQTEDGSVPATQYPHEEDPQIANIKKAIASAFQANFDGTAEKEEADPQSLHQAKYT